MKNNLLSSVLIISLTTILVSSCRLLDLNAAHPISEPNETKAKNLMKEMALSHGIEEWNNISTYQIKLDDEFYGFVGKQGSPYKEGKTRISLNYVPNTFDGRLEILTGKEKGHIMGMSNWKTYTKNANDSIEFKKDKNAKFWVPTYQYFIEFPRKIQEATAFKYLGQKAYKNTLCEVILASWKTTEAQKDLDQYVIWVNASSKRIVKIDFTIRDIAKFVSGTIHFNKYKTFNGILLPSEMPVSSSLIKKGLLHKMEILSFETDILTQKQLRPKSN